jgi:hypothetical protein
MKKTSLLIVAVLLTCGAFAQTFTAGWYIVEKGAQFSAYDIWDLAQGKTPAEEEMNFGLKTGETVFVTELKGDVYYCFDPSGKPLLIKGKNVLSKTPVGFGIGVVTEEILLLSGESLVGGMFVWIVGQDVGKQTIKVQLENNTTLDVPETKIALLSALIKKNSKDSWFKDAE